MRIDYLHILKDWTDAETGTFIDLPLVKNISDPLRRLFFFSNPFKLVQQSDAESKRLVPLLISNDPVQLIKKFFETN